MPRPPRDGRALGRTACKHTPTRKSMHTHVPTPARVHPGTPTHTHPKAWRLTQGGAPQRLCHAPGSGQHSPGSRGDMAKPETRGTASAVVVGMPGPSARLRTWARPCGRLPSR